MSRVKIDIFLSVPNSVKGLDTDAMRKRDKALDEVTDSHIIPGIYLVPILLPE